MQKMIMVPQPGWQWSLRKLIRNLFLIEIRVPRKVLEIAPIPGKTEQNASFCASLITKAKQKLSVHPSLLT